MNAPVFNRWISCAERMPEDDAEVLAYSPSHGAIVILTQYFKMLNVTHWMPLPDLPLPDLDAVARPPESMALMEVQVCNQDNCGMSLQQLLFG